MKKRTSPVFLLLFLSYASIYVARLNLSMASPVLIENGVLSAVQLGFLGSVFSVVYSCGRLVNGVLSDRFLPKLFIIAGLLLAGISNILEGFLPRHLVFFLLWGVNAFAQSMIWSALLRTLSVVYGSEQADRRVSLMVSSVSVGNIAAILLSSWLVEYCSVQAAFFVPGMLTILLGGLCAWVLKDTPDPEPKGNAQRLPLTKPDPALMAALAPAAFHGVMKENISLWMAVYFTHRFSVDLSSSAYYILLIPAVGFVGRLLFPGCYGLCRRNEKMLSVIAFAVCALLSVVLGLSPGSPVIAAVCLSLIYACVSIINTALVSIFPLRFVQQGAVASVSGILDFMTYLGGGISAAIYGVFAEKGHFAPMFFSWAALSLLSMLMLGRQTKIERGGCENESKS